MANKLYSIDWLEVYVFEPIGYNDEGINTPERLRQLGFIIEEREYGTQTYEQMLKVSIPEFDSPMFEIRRKPRKSREGKRKFFLDPLSAHIRLTNRMCYAPNPVGQLVQFLLYCGYEFRNIKRVDVCLDFNYFESGESPADFLRSYILGKVAKINQSNVSVHGKDSWLNRDWNSCAWGSSSSNVITRFYNKTLEMKQNKMKAYIQEKWIDAGLNLGKDVWRVEFAIKTGIKIVGKQTEGELRQLLLSEIDTPAKIATIWHSFALKYFRFKKVEYLQDGTPQRKDRCADKVLFSHKDIREPFEATTYSYKKDLGRTDKILYRRLEELEQDITTPEYLKEHIRAVKKYFWQEYRKFVSPINW